MPVPPNIEHDLTEELHQSLPGLHPLKVGEKPVMHLLVPSLHVVLGAAVVPIATAVALREGTRDWPLALDAPKD
ncbi:MAG: hypothetical protein OEQ49_12375 [Myxococcales bacterium]|nr:hypothetical protein [Myxococcales bacterium]